MIKLKLTQDKILVELMKASDGVDDESLLLNMVERAKVDRPTAEAYLSSYRFNSRTGSIGNIVRVVEEGNTFANDNPNPLQSPVAKKQPTFAPVKRDPSEGGGIVAQIINLYKNGSSVTEIIEAGYNKSTVYRQVNEYKKRVKALKG